MKLKITMIALTLGLSASALAVAKPITADVQLKSEKFAKMVYTALEKSGNPKRDVLAGSTNYTITIEKGLRCVKSDALVSGGKHLAKYHCSLLKSGKWSSMGNEAYGAGENEALSLALFETLDVAAESDEAFNSKTIKLEVPDQDGGTERNQFTCMSPTKTGDELGMRPTCQVLNAL